MAKWIDVREALPEPHKVVLGEVVVEGPQDSPYETVVLTSRSFGPNGKGRWVQSQNAEPVEVIFWQEIEGR